MCNNNIESFDSLFIKTCFLIGQVKLINPIKVYSNFKEERLQLIKDHKNKAGIYCLVNLINGITYIGSSINIQVRLRNYLKNPLCEIIRKNKYAHCKSIVKIWTK